MKKNIVIVGLCLAALFLLSRSCGLTEKYKQARADYNELKKITDADHALSLSHISELNNAIESADKVIAQKDAVIAEKTKKITLLTSQLAEIVGQEPPTTPDIEAMPIVVNLRAQVSKLSELYSISVDIINEKDKIIDQWAKKFDAQVKISDEWKGQYDREHALRVSSEKLVVSLERRVKIQGVWGNVKAVALGVVAGVAVKVLSK